MTLTMRGPVGGGKLYFALTKRQGQDFRVVQGSDNDWTIVFDDSEALDWSSFSARGDIRADFKDFAPDVLATITVLIQVSAPGLAKQLFCRITNAASDALKLTEGMYDIEITNGTVVRRVVSETPWANSLQTSGP